MQDSRSVEKPDFSASDCNMISCFHVLLSISAWPLLRGAPPEERQGRGIMYTTSADLSATLARSIAQSLVIYRMRSLALSASRNRARASA